MRVFRFAVLTWGVAGLLSVPIAAQAQNHDMRALSQRLAQMERQISQMSRDVYRDGGVAAGGGVTAMAPVEQSNAGLAAAMDSRMATLEGEIRRINNRLDEQDYALTQLRNQFEMLRSDLDVRLSEISGQKPAGSEPISSYQEPSAPIAAPLSDATSGLNFDNPATLYDQAFQALREQNYAKAQQGFDGFLKRYPNDQLAGNAKYWLGETYYVRGDFARAARVFAEGYQQYPKSSKGPDNLLKLGISLSNLNKKQEACVTFAQLEKDYRNAAAVIKQRADVEKQKLGC